MVQFIYSSANQEFKWDPNKNYLLYFRGCCCPPQKGHLNAITELLQNRTNMKIIIDQIADRGRHGVPRSLSVSIWKKFIKHCLPKNSTLLQNGHFFDSNYVPYVQDRDVIVFIRGDEGKSHFKVERKFKKKKQKVINQLKKLNKEIIYYSGKRKNGLSATDFIRSLKKNHDFDTLKSKFLPDQLNDRSAHKIIDRLQKCSLKI